MKKISREIETEKIGKLNNREQKQILMENRIKGQKLFLDWQKEYRTHRYGN